MIKSMTGFASLTQDDEAATITVTIRSVNHRFLDLQLRLPSSLAPLESRLRARVQQRVARGRVEVAVSLQQRRAATLDVELNEAFLQALDDAVGQFGDHPVGQEFGRMLSEINMGTAVYSTPITANGTMIIMTHNELFAIQEGAQRK